jgi:hypothetical protein
MCAAMLGYADGEAKVKTQNPKPKTQNPKPKTQNQYPGFRVRLTQATFPNTFTWTKSGLDNVRRDEEFVGHSLVEYFGGPLCASVSEGTDPPDLFLTVEA